MNKSIHKIVHTFLLENGFSGLFHPDGECGCDIEDLFPCDQCGLGCTAGYKVVVPDGVNDDYNFYICATKEEKPWEHRLKI